LTPSARSGSLIAGDGTKNGLPAPNKELQQTKNNYLTGKAPYKFESISLQRRVCNLSVPLAKALDVFRATAHRLPRGGRHARKRAGHGGSRKPAHDEITLDEVERITI
jgi:hypothetical protein